VVDPAGLVPIVTIQTSRIVIALLSIAIVMALTWVMSRYIDRIDALLGRRGSAILSKLMAIFIAAIAVQFILTYLSAVGLFGGVEEEEPVLFE
jgi:multiple antibiotic resistance protein